MDSTKRSWPGLEGLNPEQRRAVESVQGRLLILAGAGSGKTKVLMSRMAYLIGHCNVEPSHILGLTFTNKAAQEMRNRLARLIGPGDAKRVTLGTFHSFCLKLLREHAPLLGFTKRFSLYHEHDVRRLIQQIVRDELEHEGQLPSLGATIERISKARQLAIEPSELPISGEPWHHRFCQVVYDRLRMAFRAYDAMDFDALLEYAVKLIETHEEVSQQLTDRYRYVMIDEYQDTNPIQDRLAHLLARHGNLCVVGDDDQSIYGWRGGDIRNILEFPSDHTIKLEQNYRSTNGILEAANRVIVLNEQRYSKTLWSEKGQGENLEVFHAPSSAQEAQSVVARMLKLRSEKGLKWRDFAILYRSNALARDFETALMRQAWQDSKETWHRSIPYEVYGGDSFYDCREVRDLTAYLSVIVNPRDQSSLLRIINQPRRGIGEATLDRLTSEQREQAGGSLIDYVEKYSSSSEIHSGARLGLQKFLQIMETAKERFATASLSSSLEWLIHEIDYEKAIQEEVKSEAMRTLKRQNLLQLVQSAREFEQSNPLTGLEGTCEFASSCQLDTPVNASRQRVHDAVHLMTFHSAKGLEFPAVFLVGLEDHILPHERSLEVTGIEEERRLFYVALTRAEKYLTLSMATIRDRYGKLQASKPSRFLFDIPSTLLRISKWDDVQASYIDTSHLPQADDCSHSQVDG